MIFFPGTSVMLIPRIVLMTTAACMLSLLAAAQASTDGMKTHKMSITPDAPAYCNVSSEFDGQVHQIDITFTAMEADPNDLVKFADGALWKVTGEPTATKVSVKVTSASKHDLSASFTVSKKRKAREGSGGGNSAEVSGKGYVSQIQIHAYKLNDTDLMPRATKANTDNYAFLLPHEANHPTKLKLKLNKSDLGLGNAVINLVVPVGVETSGLPQTKWEDANAFPGEVEFTARLKEGITGPQNFVVTLTTEKGGTATDKVSLLPVEVKEVWSNQIADVEVNGFPDKTGRNNQPYSIMGVRDNGNAYIRLKLKSAIPAEFRQKILFRLRQPQISKPGSSSFGAGGDVVDVIAKNVSDNPEISHRVYFGYDSDDDGELSEAEASGNVDSTANGQDRIPIEFKIISKTRHEQSRLKNIEFAGNGYAGIVPNMAPTGASLIKSFHKSLPPDSNTTNATTIDRTGDKRLTHPVGVAFEPTEVPGDAVNGVYNWNHLLAENVLKSQPFRNACRDGFDTILPILIARRERTGISEDFLTFTWEETVGDPSLNFNLNQKSVPNMPDFDSFLALGKVRVENARVGFRYDLNAQFVEVFFQGSFKDLYDFDYDCSIDLMVWSLDQIRQGAETQAGYPTLTNGGKVFTTQLDIRDGDKYIDSGYSFFLYK